MKRRIEEEVDRISTLPDEVLLHILSFIPFNNVAQVSLLSKRWEKLWHEFPIMEVDARYSHYGKRKKIIESLKRTLFHRTIEIIGLTKLKLEVELFYGREHFSLVDQCHDFGSLIDRCFRYAVQCNVKELDLCFIGCLYDSFLPRRWYNLPRFVFDAKSIEALELHGCNLEFPGSDVYLPCLKKLCLGLVYADDHVIQNLVARCPSIEYLGIGDCKGSESLDLFSHKLQFIKFWLSHDCTLERVDINGLNVQEIDIINGPLREINVDSCKNLNCLKLSGFSLMDERLNNRISQLPFLEHLEVFHCMKLRAVQISSPHLGELIIIQCWDLVEINIETPNLGIFKYQGDIISFSSNAVTLLETVLQFDTDITETQQYIKFIELLAKFNHFSNALGLHSNCESVIVPKELRHILSPPLTSVKNLKFTINDRYEFLEMTKIVDGLLWISPHPKTILFSYKNQFSYQEESPHCCQCLPVSCWQNCLREVKVEKITKSGGNIIDVKRYSFEYDEILEKIDDLYTYLMHESDTDAIDDVDDDDDGDED